jgi:CBS domain-containing protein
MPTERERTERSDVPQRPRTEKEPSRRGSGPQTVRDVMTPNPETVNPGDRLQQAARRMVECDCGAIPVVEGDKLVGIITDRDIVVRVIAEGRNPADVPVSEVMTREVACVRENDPLDRVMDLMSEHKVRRIPVVDEQNRVIGIVAQADLATEVNDEEKVARTVEEISEKS